MKRTFLAGKLALALPKVSSWVITAPEQLSRQPYHTTSLPFFTVWHSRTISQRRKTRRLTQTTLEGLEKQAQKGPLQLQSTEVTKDPSPTTHRQEHRSSTGLLRRPLSSVHLHRHLSRSTRLAYSLHPPAQPLSLSRSEQHSALWCGIPHRRGCFPLAQYKLSRHSVNPSDRSCRR